MLRRLSGFAALLVVIAACAPAAGTTTTSTARPTTTTTQPVVTTSTTTTTTIPVTTTTTLPGEPVDYGPLAGDEVMVVGVAYDDFLNLRALPGADQEIIGAIDPLFTGLVAKGETRDLPGAFWIKVDHQGTVGWVHMSFIGYMGLTDDMTSSVVTNLGEYPTADDMTALGLIVAETFASIEPASHLVIVVAATVGDLGEVTYDVIGIGDDSVLGFRVHVFGMPVTDGFSLKSVEVTTICGRGLTPDGICP